MYLVKIQVVITYDGKVIILKKPAGEAGFKSDMFYFDKIAFFKTDLPFLINLR